MDVHPGARRHENGPGLPGLFQCRYGDSRRASHARKPGFAAASTAGPGWRTAWLRCSLHPAFSRAGRSRNAVSSAHVLQAPRHGPVRACQFPSLVDRKPGVPVGVGWVLAELARRKDVSNRQMEESMYQMLRAFAGKGLGAGLLLAILSLGSASGAAAQTAPSTATGVPIEWVPRADRANEAPISRVHYEVEVRQFNREPCEFEGGILTPGRVSTQDLIEQFLLGECNPEERFETIRANCPGSPLKVIGGGVRVSNRRAATVVDSYPDENGVDAETGAWVVHIERRPVVDFEREEIAMPAVRVQVTAVCAEVRESERDSDGGDN